MWMKPARYLSWPVVWFIVLWLVVVTAGCKTTRPHPPLLQQPSHQTSDNAKQPDLEDDPTIVAKVAQEEDPGAGGNAQLALQPASFSEEEEAVSTSTSDPAFVIVTANAATSESQSIPLTVTDAVRESMQNATIFRTAGTYLSTANPILLNPQAVNTVYDRSVAQTGVLFGQRSVSAARSDFDPRFGTTSNWYHDEQVQNNQFLSGGLLPGATLSSDTTAFQMRLDKQLMSGGTVGLVQDWNYDANNVTQRLFQSAYIGQARAEFRQPMLAGAGKDFNKIAGPNSQNGITGVQQGIVIASINEQMSELDTHQALNSMLREVEFQYWQYRAAWEQKEQAERLLNAVKETAEIVEERSRAGGVGGGQSSVARFQDIVMTTEIDYRDAVANLQNQEGNLRRMIGWDLNASNEILPVSEPSSAPLVLDADECLGEAYSFRPELQRSQAQIRSLQLQAQAARSLRKPRLDLVANYHVNGFGDHLIADTNFDGKTPQGYNNATGSLLRGDQKGWQMGFEFLYPIGSRLARTQQSNLEFQVARANAILKEQEREISHEIAASIRNLDRVSFAVQTNQQRVDLAQRRMDAVTVEYETKGTPDLLVDLVTSQQTLATAKRALSSSLSEYMVAQTDLLYRTGTLNEQHEIRIADSTRSEIEAITADVSVK